MTATATPVRAAVFETVAQARHAANRLLAAGLSPAQITVMCSDEATQRKFAAYEHQHPSGAHTAAAAVAGGSVGAAIGGAAAVAGAFAVGGPVAALAAGGLAIWSGAAVGGLVGAMLTRGWERELADHYAQAVVDGQILVAADTEDPALLARAEQVFASEGAQPRSLPEG